MHASNLARQLLTDAWELGRLILVTIAVGSAWGAIVKRSEEQNERFRYQTLLVLIMLGIMGPFIAAVFFDLQTANIIALMRIKRGWGIFTGLVALLVLLFLVTTGLSLLAANRTVLPLSLRNAGGEMPPPFILRNIKMILLPLSMLIGSSIFWLWRIAQ